MNGGYPLSSLNAPSDKRISAELHRRAMAYFQLQSALTLLAVAVIFTSLTFCGVIHRGMISGAPFIIGVVFTALTLFVVLSQQFSAAKTTKKRRLDSDQNWGLVAANQRAGGGNSSASFIPASSSPSQSQSQRKKSKQKVFPTSEERASPARESLALSEGAGAGCVHLQE